MAWENLDEDIATEFSDNRSLDWKSSRYRVFSSTTDPTKWKHAGTLRRARARHRQISQLLAGARPSRCAGPGCANLLPVIPPGGEHQRFCSSRCCHRPKWTATKRRQRERRRALETVSGKRPTHCKAGGCENPLPPSTTKVWLYCSERCGARERRRQRSAGTAGGGSAAAPGASGAHE